MGERDYGQDPGRIAAIARAVRDVHELGIEHAIVVGGGNILRGTQEAARGDGPRDRRLRRACWRRS